MTPTQYQKAITALVESYGPVKLTRSAPYFAEYIFNGWHVSIHAKLKLRPEWVGIRLREKPDNFMPWGEFNRYSWKWNIHHSGPAEDARISTLKETKRRLDYLKECFSL